MIDGRTLIAFGASLGAALALLNPFRRTSHGRNPWDLEGVAGVLHIMGHVERVATLAGARWTSVFRSEAVQRSIYEAKRRDPAQWAVVQSGAKARGVSVEAYIAALATGSRHGRGLAADFAPREGARWANQTIAGLAADIYQLALQGKIGPVKKVLDERDHVHVEWYGPGETPKAPVSERL